MFLDKSWNYVFQYRIYISDLVRHIGATVTVHINDLAHLLLVLLLASMVIASSSLPWTSVVCSALLPIIAHAALAPV